jgi:hypothetical protein
VLVGLDNQLLLTFTDLAAVRAESAELLLDGFVQSVFDWQEYGSLAPHATVYRTGAVKIVREEEECRAQTTSPR